MLAPAISPPYIFRSFDEKRVSHATRQKPKDEEIGCQTVQDHGYREGHPQSPREAALVELQESTSAAAVGDGCPVGSI